MPNTTYPFNNQYYIGSLSNFYFNGDPVMIPQGGVLSGVGIITDQNQICLELQVTLGGVIQTITGAFSSNYIHSGDSAGCSDLYANTNIAYPNQQVLGLGFTQSGNQIVFAPYYSDGYCTVGNNNHYVGPLGDWYLNTNTVVIPSGGTLTGAGWYPRGNQLCLSIATM